MLLAARASMRRAWLAIVCAACSDGWHEDSPVDQGHTRYHAIASTDGAELAFVLEPRFVHRNEHGVLITGYTIRLTGPTVVVAGDTVTPLVVGRAKLVHSATRAWVLQQAGDQWDTEVPAFDPLPVPYVHAAIVDRATFAVGAQAMLDPPIDTPLVIGDELFDVPASGASDVERDLVVRRRADDGSATVLHAGHGFGSSVCTSAFVYQAAPDTVRIVALPAATTGDLAGIHLVDIACAGDRIAIEAVGVDDHAPRVVLYDLATQQATATLPDLTGPLALRSDGAAVIAIRPDRTIVLATAHDEASLGLVATTLPATPVVVGDQALIEGKDDVHVIDLAVGGVGPGLGTLDTLPWAAANGFVRLRDTYPMLTSLAIATAAGTTELPLPDERSLASLLITAGERLYVVASAAEDASPVVIAYDTHAILASEPLPLCDAASVLAGGPCR